jgi:signal transduction histidine kinase/DNA-binding response OmpR family regulator/ligand-binding sensor domain-containing protein
MNKVQLSVIFLPLRSIGLWLLLYCPAAAQIREENIGVREGLSQGFVTDLLQDSKGFLWIATYDGLNRYDGYEIKRYTAQPFAPWALNSAEINSIYEDQRQLLWIGTQEGVYIFDPLKERFFYLKAETYHLPSTAALNIIGNSKGEIYINFQSDKLEARLFKMQVPDDLVGQLRRQASPIERLYATRIPVQLPISTDALTVKGFFGDTLMLLCKTGGPAFRYHEKNGQFQQLSSASLPPYSDIDQGILLPPGGDQGFLFRQMTDNGHDSILHPCNRWPQVLRLENGTILLCLGELGKLYLKNDRKPLRSNPTEYKKIFESDSPFQQEFTLIHKSERPWYFPIFLDKTGVIWAGTGGYGVKKINLKHLLFKGLLAGKSISSLRPMHQGRVWVRMFNAQSAILNTQTLKEETAPWAAYRWVVSDLLADRKGNYWISIAGTHQNKTCRVAHWETATQKVTMLPGTLPYQQDVPERFLEDRDGNVWIAGCRGQLWRIRPGSFSVDTFSPSLFSTEAIAYQRATALVQSAAGDLWIGTNLGLIQVRGPHLPQPVFSVFHREENPTEGLNNTWVTCIYPDASNPARLWIGTRGGGINVLDTKTMRFNYITASSYGIPDNVVYSIVPDQYGYQWCSTNRGLCRFHPEKQTFVTFQESDGLLNTEFNTHSYLKNTDGTLWFGGVNGLNIIQPDQVHINTHPPIVAISGIKVRGQESTLDSDSLLVLPYDNNHLTIDFSALDFTNSGTNRYRYRMIGLHNDWIEIGTRHSANFPALQPRKYLFEVQGATAGSDWSRPIRLEIIIRPPWYLSWPTKIFYLLLGAALLYLYIHYRVQHFRLKDQADISRKESDRLKAFDAVKNRFFVNLAHELRTPLTVILGLAERTQRQSEELETRQHSLRIADQGQTLMALSEQILELAKLDSNHLKLHPVCADICAFCRQLTENLAPVATARGIQLQFSAQPSSIRMDFDPVQFPKILNNLLSNAIRHSRKDSLVELKITLDTPETSINIQVIDTGEGISAADLPHIFERYYQSNAESSHTGTSGIGLTLAKELAELMGGSLTVESVHGEGATFTLCLPRTQNAALLAQPEPSTVRSPVPQLLIATTADTELPLVLVAEDNEDLAQFLEICLNGYFRVISVSNGQEAYQKALQIVPDMVLTDVAMPGMDGITLCARLKAHQATSHVPVVMLTAKVEPEDRVAARQRGADAYLTKPFHEQELLWTLNNLMHLRQQWKNYLQTPADTTTTDTNAQTDIPPERLQVEDAFIQSLYGVFEQNYTKEAFNLEKLCQIMNMSSSQLDRKLKALTDQSPMEMLRLYRLEKARQLLRSVPPPSVSEVCFQVGFKNPAHFSRLFNKVYGKPPSEIRPDPE